MVYRSCTVTSEQVPTAATTPKEILGRNIRRARLGAGLTQSALARAIGVTESQTVSNWERARFKPTDENLAAICQITGHALAWFYVDHPTQVAAA